MEHRLSILTSMAMRAYVYDGSESGRGGGVGGVDYPDCSVETMESISFTDNNTAVGNLERKYPGFTPSESASVVL